MASRLEVANLSISMLQWDALPSSGGMNSRNHIMFAGPLGWMYT